MIENQEFINLIQQTLPSNEAKALLEALNEPVLTSVRINRKKIQKINVEFQSVKHCKDGFILKDRPIFTADPALHAGAYYVQESNSMWIGEIVRNLLPKIDPGAIVLDLCGAPGGKSTHIASVLRDGDLLVANEVIQSRNAILYENLCKWGAGNAVVTRSDAKIFGKNANLFDIIACDAPCSGEGMFRKDSGAIDEWSISNVQLCAERQQRIVHDVWNALKPGGFLIYSTCTYNRSENEDNVFNFCEEFGASLIPIDFEGQDTLFSLEESMYRCLPHRTSGEGLFFAVLQKPTNNQGDKYELSQSQRDFESYKKNQNKKGKAQHKSGKKGLELPFSRENWGAFEGFDGLYTLKLGDWYNNHPNLIKELPNVVHPGVGIGKVYNDDWKVEPSFDLLSENFNEYPTQEIDIHDAIRYFRREFLNLQVQQKGIVGLRWNGLHLGTANAVKNGMNNLWPVNWRIRSEFEAKSII